MITFLVAVFAMNSCVSSQGTGGGSSIHEVGREHARRAVPHLVGLPLEDAQQVLRLAELNSSEGVFYIHPDLWREEITPKSVGLQVPRAGALISVRSAVGIWTLAPAKKGQSIVEMPDLGGLNPDLADAELQKVGLVLMKPIDPAYTAGDGGTLMIVDQYPQPGQSVYERTSVLTRLGTDQLHSTDPE